MQIRERAAPVIARCRTVPRESVTMTEIRSRRRSASRALVAGALVCAAVARSAQAQSGGVGRLDGTVVDSAHARPLAGVRVVAIGAGARADARGSAMTDTVGQFRIDSLPAGRYVVGIESPLLDSLEIAPPAREAIVTDGGTTSVELATPSGAKLRAAVCPGVALPPRTGAIYGRVVNAESESPLAGVTIAMMWRELDLDRKTLQLVNGRGNTAVTTDDGGWYLACGVPTGTWIEMELQHEGRVSSVVRALVNDTVGVAIRHLSFAASAARSIVVASTQNVKMPPAELLTGRAKLTGVVRGAGDQPVASAEVAVRGTAARTRTDSLGHYALAALPAGTHMLEVRRVGYAVAERPVELREDTAMTADVRMQRVVNLDSMRVVAINSRYTEFEQHRKTSIFGRFLGEKEMEWQRRMPYASDIIEKFPMFRVYGEGPKAVVIDPTFYPPCKVNVVVDGMERQEINDTPAFIIGAMELYRAGMPMPAEIIGNGCGAIVIWTKRGR